MTRFVAPPEGLHRVLPIVLLTVALMAGGCATDRGAAPAAVSPPTAPDEARLVAGLELPATFTGTLPSAGPGIRYRLNLWPDGVFHLQREWLGRDFEESDVGRWRRDPARNAILLYGGLEMALQFSVQGPRTLRQLDISGRPIESELPYELTSEGELVRLELELALRGMFTYLADAPRFEECLTGRSYPVAMEGAYIELERAYLAADKPAPGAPLLAALEGAITERPAMEGDRLIPTVVVRRFIGLFPSQTCERAMSEASLPNTWSGARPRSAAVSRDQPGPPLGAAALCAGQVAKARMIARVAASRAARRGDRMRPSTQGGDR